MNQAIILRDLSIGFPEKTVREHIDLTLAFGKSYALMGESGSGKTTLLRTAAGLIKPLRGSIDGMDGRRVSYMFQEDRLLPWLTALENVAVCSDRARAEDWLRKMEIADPGQRPAQMSGGMQRRVALARAMAFGGDILFMDEPFKGLDAALRERVIGRVRGVYPLTVLAIHDPAEAEMMGAEIIRL